MNLPRLLRTVRYLKPRQVAWQLIHRGRRAFENPERFAHRSIPPFEGCKWPPGLSFIPAYTSQSPDDVTSGRFTFLNETAELGRPVDWQPPTKRKLWLYHLHYFDYLWCLHYTAGKELVREWIGSHPLRSGNVGWEAYTISLRVMNWCAFFWGKWRSYIDRDSQFQNELWRSLALQVMWLQLHLERHLLGNHLLENAAAIFLFGGCFRGSLALDCALRGGPLLHAQIEEQVLPDGGHFERSPMYQTRVAHVLAMLWIAREGANDDIGIRDGLQRTTDSLIHQCHPDGDIALLNDSALRTYHKAGELCSTIRERLEKNLDRENKLGPFALKETGYFGFRSQGDYVICDAGPVGPDYLPGHAHGDIFSFELSLNGHRAIVDAGVHDYDRSDLRAYCRSTRAHNTIEIDGQDQCEFWAAFRVGSRGRPHDLKWEPRSDGFDLSGWHDGYCRLPGRPRHHRRFEWRPPGVLQVWDRVVSLGSHELSSRVHLAPDCAITRVGGSVVHVSSPWGEFHISFCGSGNLTVEPSLYCSEFGLAVENKAIVFKARMATLWEGGFSITPGRSARL